MLLHFSFLAFGTACTVIFLGLLGGFSVVVVFSLDFLHEPSGARARPGRQLEG